MPPENLSIRNVRPEDKREVLEICERVSGQHDYVTKVWDNWISNEASAGEFRLAMINERIAGFYHLAHRGRQSWMEGLRVDIDSRRLGIGTALTQDAVNRAKRKSARTIRLVTSQTNMGSRRLFEEMAFQEVLYPQYMRLEGSLIPSSKTDNIRIPDRNEIIDFVHSSGELSSRFLSPLWWRWWEFDENVLDESLANGLPLALGDSNHLDSLALIDTTSRFGYGNSVQITLLTGTIEAMQTMIRSIPNHIDRILQKDGISRYFSIPVADSAAGKALVNSGFHDGTKLVVIQKILN